MSKEMVTENNKRIAKNTVMLYIRMLITILVSLYTVRIVLNTLGVTDYGIYNVVGGVVAMFGFISNTMASASQRFLAFEIGRNDLIKLKQTFSVTVTIYLIFATIILILAETIGLWFVTIKLNFPEERLIAAIWVYQFSALSFIVTILRIPFNAAIIAHERLDFFVWISIIEVTLKLVTIFLLVWLSFDKLILYAILMFFVVLTITIAYRMYCLSHFNECKYRFIWDKKLFESMFSFAGWNLFASLARVGMNQGVNILLNLFFGPVVNAARGIAFQVNSQVVAFVGNFQIAASPQIIKYYAVEEISEMKKLLYQSSRLSYYLLFFIALPVMIEMNILLKWWLTEVPVYTALFARLVIINTLVDCLSGTIIPAVQATGKIKYYQIFVGTTILLNVPVSYLFLKQGYPPETTMIISISLSSVALFVRLFVVRMLLGFKIREYLNEVVKYNIIITAVSSIFPLYVHFQMKQGVITFFTVGFICVLTSSISIIFFGLKKNERAQAMAIIKNKLGKLKLS